MCRHQASIYPTNDVSSAVTVANSYMCHPIQEPQKKNSCRRRHGVIRRSRSQSVCLPSCPSPSGVGMLGLGLSSLAFSAGPAGGTPVSCFNSKAHVSELVSWTTNLSFVFFPGARPRRQAGWMAHQPGKGHHLRRHSRLEGARSARARLLIEHVVSVCSRNVKQA